MAEDEIRKHTKAALQATRNPETHWKHKVKKVLTEVMIIVFAITLSLWFHNWSDSRQERKQEKEFLTGFKSDVQTDMQNLMQSKDFYQMEWQGFNYFSKVSQGDSLNRDSMHIYSSIFFSMTNLEPRVSRYEGLKGSGKFDIIENKELLNDIITLQEENIVQVQLLDNVYRQFIEKMTDYIQQQAELNNSGEIVNAQQLLHTTRMRFWLGYARSTIPQNIIPVHDSALQTCRLILTKINKELQ